MARCRNFSINEEDFQEATDGKYGAGDGDPFRPRSRSAPPAFWAAKKYGRELRKMSDEFDTLLDKGVKDHRSNGKEPKKFFIFFFFIFLGGIEASGRLKEYFKIYRSVK